MPNENDSNSVYVSDSDLLNKRIVSVPKPEKDIGIDTSNVLYQNIENQGVASSLDITSLENFLNVSGDRNQIYQLLDTMAEDPIISAALEIYAEDSTERNQDGRIIWAEANDDNVLQFVTYLLDTMCVDKNIYKWTHSLCKYGDVYLRLYRQSEYEDDLFSKGKQHLTESAEELNEDVRIKAFRKDDNYTHYVEMVPNPAEVFELTKFGKTYAYIQSHTSTNAVKNDLVTSMSVYKYKFKKNDVDLYQPTEFVHACLEDNSSRTPEEVNIFIDDNADVDTDSTNLKYTVRRGQSILYNTFKIWREMMLLENSVLLNRVTKSSIVRVIGVTVGDMPKENVGKHLMGIKNMIEQKAAISSGNSMTEYTNPGPVENNIYVPIYENGIGTITASQIGGDVDVKSLADLDYFKNKLYASLKIPKQYLGDTDDATGFNGGTALSLESSRYAKTVRRIQTTLCQMITDAVNLMLIDKNLDSYVNKFSIKMVPPITQEDVNRMENVATKLGNTRDIMDLLADIDNPVTKLQLTKVMLSDYAPDPEILSIIDDVIEEKKSEQEEYAEQQGDDNEMGGDMFGEEEPLDLGGGGGGFDFGGDSAFSPEAGGTSEPEFVGPSSQASGGAEGGTLPSPSSLNADIDFSDANALG